MFPALEAVKQFPAYETIGLHPVWNRFPLGFAAGLPSVAWPPPKAGLSALRCEAKLISCLAAACALVFDGICTHL
jgi:hypothetical protein